MSPSKTIKLYEVAEVRGEKGVVTGYKINVVDAYETPKCFKACKGFYFFGVYSYILLDKHLANFSPQEAIERHVNALKSSAEEAQKNLQEANRLLQLCDQLVCDQLA